MKKKYPNPNMTGWYILGLAMLCILLFPVYMLAGFLRKLVARKAKR
jgi:hypothetical protein